MLVRSCCGSLELDSVVTAASKGAAAGPFLFASRGMAGERPVGAVTWAMPAGSLDRWPEDYERGRPGWPPEALELPGLLQTASVLDLGAGTGKLTRILTSRFDRVVAVEPAEAMRRLLMTVCPEAQALAGTAQNIPLDNDSVDAVFAAQAFHWFDDEPAVGEIVRVLRPGGALVLMWNLPAGPTQPSLAPVEELLKRRMPQGDLGYDPLDLGGPHYAAGEWGFAVKDVPFEQLRTARLPNPQVIDREGVVAFFASMGWLADLPEGERLPLLDEVRSLLDADQYCRPWETHVHWTRLALRPRGGDHERSL
jgi:SAM-dependent methyltransferase